jgi:hypothetical protein
MLWDFDRADARFALIYFNVDCEPIRKLPIWLAAASRLGRSLLLNRDWAVVVQFGLVQPEHAVDGV